MLVRTWPTAIAAAAAMLPVQTAVELPAAVRRGNLHLQRASLAQRGRGGANRQGGVSLGPAGNGAGSPGDGTGPGGGGGGDDSAMPNAYRLRVAPNRSDLAKQQGGSTETEAAVKAALKWLADHQLGDGHWDRRATAPAST